MMPDRPLVRRFAPSAAWASVLFLALLSLLPKDDMIRTGADGRIEHFVAYAGTMALWALGYGRRYGTKPLAAGLAGYAGLLELAQHLSPGRSPSLADFAAGALGVVAAALVSSRLLRC